MAEKFSLKDQLFNKQKVKYLTSLIQNVYPAFEHQIFVHDIIAQFPALELKARIACIRDQLKLHLPKDFELALSIILKALPPPLDPNKSDDDFGDFIFAPLADFVAKNGLQTKYLDLSFNVLAEITKRFSCEDAIRYFINQYPNQSFAFMQQMVTSDNYHQRRLASEGLRPKLPWCIGINFDYKQAIPILDNLYFDSTRYVVRSVANHLNDVAKIDAELVIRTLKKWQKEGRQKDKKELDFLTKHALRTLVKQGNATALALLGFDANPQINIKHFNLKNQQIALDEYLDFSFEITSTTNEKLMLDYKIIYPTQNARQSEKVFKIKQLTLCAGETITIHKKHLFKLMSSKKLYTGKHQIQLQINGRILAQSNFKLVF